MSSYLCLIVTLSTLVYLCLASDSSKTDSTDSTEKTGLHRSGRNYDKYYKSPKNYGDSGDDSEDNQDDYQPDSSPGQPPNGYNGYKGFGYNYPPFVPAYKGYPHYPTFKGGFKFPGSAPQADLSSMTPDQIMSMMAAISNPEDSKDEEGGFLSKLFSDPKTLTTAAIVPLGLILASVVPVVMNYMMTGMSPSQQVISTTATNNKEARNLIDASSKFEKVLENIAEFARAIEGDECIQMALCRVASSDANMPGVDYIKKAANAVSGFVKEDWINSIGAKDILEGIKDGNCSNVCNRAKLTPNNRK